MLEIRGKGRRPLPPAAARSGFFDLRLTGGWPLAVLSGLLLSALFALVAGGRSGLSAAAGWALTAGDLHAAFGLVPRTRSRKVLLGLALGGFAVRALLFSLGCWLVLVRAGAPPVPFVLGAVVGVLGSLAPAAFRAAMGVGFELWTEEG